MRKQWGTYDTLSDRREIMGLFVRLGDGLPDDLARQRRAKFLQSLMRDSDNGFSLTVPPITPCSAVDAYQLFVAITGCLGVDIDIAARRLEAEVRGR